MRNVTVAVKGLVQPVDTRATEPPGPGGCYPPRPLSGQSNRTMTQLCYQSSKCLLRKQCSLHQLPCHEALDLEMCKLSKFKNNLNYAEIKQSEN